MTKDNSKYNIIIIGSGFSGIAAADILADHNLSILLLDENIHFGGQLLRKIPEELGDYPDYKPDKIKRVGFSFVEKVKNKKITLMNKTILLGVYKNNEILVEYNREKTLSLKYDVLLFATGAKERFLPFKGWTLPGVYSTGMLQVLIKSSGVLPVRRMLMAGSGLFLFAAAYEFLKNGGDLLGIMEQSPFWNKIKFFPQMFHQFSKFAEGGRYLSKIYFSGVPVKYRRHIIEARGDKSLEEVVVGKLDKKGELIKGSEKTYRTEALIVGYGFVPNIEAPQMAGCVLEYAREMGGWIVSVTDRMQTSVRGILAAGEITGVGGAQKSLTEGKLAAYNILEQLGIENKRKLAPLFEKLTKERKQHMSFVKCFNSLYEIKPKTVLAIPDDTIICRCESIDMKSLKDAIQMGKSCRDPNSLKVSTRCAMGQCQGRICGPVIYDLLHALCDKSPEEIGLFSVRPPLKPVTIKALENLRDS
ncbi:MAG: FAD-dependent oxidoreductase [Candidatus Aminicenantes bacterium]|nr:FAD-dependent oxidoreductase [Candidatus Aminicenantes bacterium]